MPRANRHFLPHHVWHITHRYHKKEFLLKFSHDRQRWIHWLFEAKKRYGLAVLNYMVASNHIQLLVVDSGEQVVAQSLQLIAGRTAQAYNQRKGCKGAFWEDRYHATAIDTDEHLYRCFVYIDLNMVRAGVVSHPKNGPIAVTRKSSICENDMPLLIMRSCKLCGVSRTEDFQAAHRDWIAAALQSHQHQRQPHWFESLAVGSEAFINCVDKALGYRKPGRIIEYDDRSLVLKEPTIPYNINFRVEKDGLS